MLRSLWAEPLDEVCGSCLVVARLLQLKMAFVFFDNHLQWIEPVARQVAGVHIAVGQVRARILYLLIAIRHTVH